MNRKTVINAVKAIVLNKAKPSCIWLYGSEASGEPSDNSDIDMTYLDTNGDSLKRNCILSAIKDEAENISTLIQIDIANIVVTEESFY
ncbi:MAG: putative nucleotidyltransferase [Pseudohongiellaceae bacterium]|jgi:predicted nucleotidyltransferase